MEAKTDTKNYQAIADAIRAKNGAEETYTPAEMAGAIRGLRPRTVTHSFWTRPIDWPDYDSLNLRERPEDYSLYLTYDCRYAKAGFLSGYSLSLGSNYRNKQIELGYISDGAFVPMETVTSQDGYFAAQFPADGPDFLALRIDTAQAGGDLVFRCDLPVNGSTSSIDISAEMNPCVEIYGRPAAGFSCLSYFAQYSGAITRLMQAITLLDFAPTNFEVSGYYAWARSLEYINLDQWDMSGLTKTGFSWMFANAPLRELDFSGLRHVKFTSISRMCSGAGYLLRAAFGGLDVSACTSFADIFNGCGNLQRLDISGWDMSNATTMSSMFYACYGLIELNTAGCKIAKSLNLNWSGCLSHESLQGVLNALIEVDETQTLALTKNSKTLLTEDEIAIATQKGWTIA